MAHTSVSISSAAVEPAQPKNTGKTVGEKRKPVRRDLEKRRQQNLQAQKKYRDKLRKRLDDLEILAASVATSRETPAVVTEAASSYTSPISDGTTPDSTPEEWTMPLDTPQAAQAWTPTTNKGSYVHFVAPPATTNEDCSRDLLLWDSATSIDPSYLTMANYGRPGNEKELWYRAYVDCGCKTRHVEIRTKAPGTNTKVEIVSVGESSLSLRANHLRVETLCIISAMYANCQQLGYSPDAFCCDESQSAFYRPGACLDLLTGPGENGSPNSVVQTVQKIYKGLRPDLRPTKEQIMFPHDQFLDIMPFPTLRSNLLNNTEYLDEDEFCFDILNGLTCWGGAGLGQRDRNGGTGRATTATPWDSRSWEAKPWFLRKYWKLLGGEDGELVRQSQWWRGMRGEEEDIWAGACEQPPAESLHFSPAKVCDAGFLGLLQEQF